VAAASGESALYQLYFYPGNANLAPHMVLREIGAPVELVRVDRDRQAHKGAEYLKLNPNGVIPVLVDGDLVLYEAAAICLHLADRHPEAGLAPALATQERAHFYKWLIYLTNTVQAELLTYFYPERWHAEPTGAAVVKASAEARVGTMLDRIEAGLANAGPFLLGERLSAADFYLFMLARWTREMARPARDLPALRRLLDRLAARPAVSATFAAEGLSPPLF
jgi:glutathione S-transferase